MHSLNDTESAARHVHVCSISMYLYVSGHVFMLVVCIFVFSVYLYYLCMLVLSLHGLHCICMSVSSLHVCIVCIQARISGGGGARRAPPPPFRAIMLREGGGLFPVDLSVQTANT